VSTSTGGGNSVGASAGHAAGAGTAGGVSAVSGGSSLGLSATVLVLQRARALGLPTWRTDRSGRVMAEPSARGPAGVWLRGGMVRELLVRAVAQWETQGTPEPVQSFPGCWLVPLVETHRRERIGYGVALALTGRGMEGEWFQRACDAAHLDAPSTKLAMAPLARLDDHGAKAVGTLLQQSLADLTDRHEDQEAIAGFTRQLTDGFETIDLLYTLGKSMNEVDHARQFVEQAADRLFGSMAFGWLAFWLGGDAKVSRVADLELVTRGDAGCDEAALTAGLTETAAGAAAGKGKAAILPALGSSGARGPQVLVQPIVRGGQVVGLIACGDKGGDDPQVSSYDIQLLEAAAGFAGAFLDNAVLYTDQRAMFLGTLQAMTAAIDAKDAYTRGHSERVAHLGQKLAVAVGLSAETAERVRICGLVHDVGKIGVPERVLGKAGRLTDEEFGLIKQHPSIGHHILKDIPQLADILPGVLHHHERFDGKGYPAGLKGEDVPLFARLIALADTFDAMSSNRAYRASLPREQVLKEIASCGGAQFDPLLAAAFVKLDFREYDAMVSRHERQTPHE
jgi:HD-GYP domain-containing protein (c-di-GMP phosphodiesterase class II)